MGDAKVSYTSPLAAAPKVSFNILLRRSYFIRSFLLDSQVKSGCVTSQWKKKKKIKKKDGTHLFVIFHSKVQ